MKEIPLNTDGALDALSRVGFVTVYWSEKVNNFRSSFYLFGKAHLH